LIAHASTPTFLAVVLFCAVAEAQINPRPVELGLELRSLEVGGIQRRYWLRTPARADAGGGLIFVLHGSRGDGMAIRTMIGRRLEPLAASAGFVVVYPDGFEQHWNDCRGSASYEANQRNIDDPAFLRAIIDEQVAESGIDRRRVFAVGMSNGGHMVLRLALEDPQSYAALSVIGANLPAPQGNDCTDRQQPVAITFFNGTADPINPFHGGLVRLGEDISRGYVLSTEYTAQWFARRAGHRKAPRTSIFTDLDPADRSLAERTAWIAPGKLPVMLYTIVGGGHAIPGSPDSTRSPSPVTNRDVDAARETWEFFRRVDPVR